MLELQFNDDKSKLTDKEDGWPEIEVFVSGGHRNVSSFELFGGGQALSRRA